MHSSKNKWNRLQTLRKTQRWSSFHCISQQPMAQSGAENLGILETYFCTAAVFKDNGRANHWDLALSSLKCTTGLCLQFASDIWCKITSVEILRSERTISIVEKKTPKNVTHLSYWTHEFKRTVSHHYWYDAHIIVQSCVNVKVYDAPVFQTVSNHK